MQLEIFPPRRSVVDKAEENIYVILLVLLRAMSIHNLILFAEIFLVIAMLPKTKHKFRTKMI